MQGELNDPTYSNLQRKLTEKGVGRSRTKRQKGTLDYVVIESDLLSLHRAAILVLRLLNEVLGDPQRMKMQKWLNREAVTLSPPSAR